MQRNDQINDLTLVYQHNSNCLEIILSTLLFLLSAYLFFVTINLGHCIYIEIFSYITIFNLNSKNRQKSQTKFAKIYLIVHFALWSCWKPFRPKYLRSGWEPYSWQSQWKCWSQPGLFEWRFRQQILPWKIFDSNRGFWRGKQMPATNLNHHLGSISPSFYEQLLRQ